MPLHFIRNDITQMNTDAVVLPANPVLEEGSGTSKAIYEAAGEQEVLGQLRLDYPDGCEMGKAAITLGYKLPARYIIHAVCPQWLGGDQGEKEFLISAYTESMRLAEENKCRSIAFPLLSTGNYKFPRMVAIRLAVDAILDYVAEHDMDVYLVFFTQEAINDGARLFGDIKSYIDDAYAEAAKARSIYRGRSRGRFENDDWYDQREFFKKMKDAPVETEELYQFLERKKESFHHMLFRLIKEKGMTDPEVYKAALLTRQHFGKIRQDKHCQPKKRTILQLAVALRLNTETAETLLKKAGYALSDYDHFDLAMKYCFDKRILDFADIDEVLKTCGYREEQLFLKKPKKK